MPIPLALVAALTATAFAPSSTAPAVQIAKVYYDSPGVDRRSNASLNGEYVTILNTTRKPIDLEHWTIKDKTGYTYTFGPDAVLGPGKKLTLRTGQGSDTRPRPTGGVAPTSGTTTRTSPTSATRPAG
ncbi:lamin tail domain-containing protein [Nonomuraea sp. NPDC049152]|uniref:lamin tail domain-containing protein n=1 Tax=Nonomuraea sp. NPDC049152 TaxID=3154350 RepID=UPI0033E62CF1